MNHIEQIDILSKEQLTLVEDVETIDLKPDKIGLGKEEADFNWTNNLTYPFVEKTNNVMEDTIAVYYIFKGRKIGFSGSNYLQFSDLVNKIYDLEMFNSKASFNFIYQSTLDWVVNSYLSTEDINKSVTEFIEDEWIKNSKELCFYFPIHNLSIESSFTIAGVEFFYIDNTMYNTIFKNKVTDEQKRQLIEPFKSALVAAYCLKSDFDFAKQNSMERAAIAMDILKLFSVTTSIPKSISNFDFEFRLNYQLSSSFLSKDNDQQWSISKEFSPGNSFISTKEFVRASYYGLNVFSDFVAKNYKDELGLLIYLSIRALSSAISNSDLHMRSVNIITILESLLLKDSESSKMVSKVKERYAKIIGQSFNQYKSPVTCLENIYHVRHKMIHKSIRKLIVNQELSVVQGATVSILLAFVEFHELSGFRSKENIIASLNERTI